MKLVILFSMLLISTVAICSNHLNNADLLLNEDKYTIEIPLDNSPPHFNSSEEREAYIQNLLNIFNKNLGNKCEAFNQKLIANDYKACEPNYCLTRYIKGNRPDELQLSLSVGKHQWFGYYALVNVTWVRSTANKPTARICMHPSFTPIAIEFETELRSKYIQFYYEAKD
jgi:hypothetical protein